MLEVNLTVTEKTADKVSSADSGMCELTNQSRVLH